ncbi:sulfonate ABC transporter permease [Bifidobacterium aquikefiri]|uniref:Sulfonate ABC transporter permease n=2 Tax=Bifidobacterium aquikefiri TaxID=1653207 RepID=A0A261G5S9_9BIFI|nr:sulfonate ABC transporter permease [Bifidobacterium aquikefiri]
MASAFTMTMSSVTTGNTAEETTHTKHSLFSDVIVIIGILALIGAIAVMLPDIDKAVGPHGIPSTISTDPGNLPYYAMRSVLRMFIALAFSLLFTVIYGLAAARSRRLGAILIPLLDILQSVPILGFLSATISLWLVLFPGSILGVEAASIFAIFTSQAWNMTFSFHRSLLSEPAELDEAAKILRLSHWQRFWKLDMPNAMIPLLWNCMMSVGGGWFFLTASEMISVNNHTYALPGIGSYVAEASQHRQLGNIGWAILTMIIVVVLIDFCLWKPLTAWAEKFRITSSGSVMQRRSLVLTIIRQSHLNDVLASLCRPVGDGLDMVTRSLGRTGSRWRVHSTRSRIGDLAFGTVITIAIAIGILAWIDSIRRGTGLDEIWHVLGLGLLTFLRVMLLTIVCSIIWVPIGASIGMNPHLSRIFQPLIQVLSSFPANFTFPLVTLWFIAWHIDINWGTMLLMSLGTQWYILFNVIAGASSIPDDLQEMTHSFRLSGWQRWSKLILPAVFGSWCTGGITAAGGAWNASIVSETVAYGHTTLTATGLGSYIAASTASGNMSKTLLGVTIMALFVVIVNRIFWHPLENLAERRFSLTS